jgi:lipoate-protein ligase B
MWSVSTNRHSEFHPFHFQDLLNLQDSELVKLRLTTASALLFAEVAPVVTVGRRQLQDPAERLRLESLGIELISGERGGNETWHGPGQWIGFVLTPLLSFTGDAMGVRKAVYRILGYTLEIAKLYEPTAHLREGPELGIWSTRGKLVSVGIKINRGYITSGFSLNCIPSESAFLGINPCGILGAQPDFILANLKATETEREFLKLPRLIQQAFSK